MFDFYWRERWKRDYDICIARILARSPVLTLSFRLYDS